MLGDLGTQTGSSTQSNTVKRPICHADRRPIRLCEQAFGTTGTVGSDRTVRRRRRGDTGEASAWQDGRHLLHHVLGSHGDKTEPPSLLHPDPYSSRSSSAHSPRARSMVADRRGWWRRGLAALLRLPAPAFRLSALHICRTKATFMLHLWTRKCSFTLYLHIL